jgi:osmotically-inducible protein OsmY
MARKLVVTILILGTASVFSVFHRSEAQEPSSGVVRGAGSPSAANAKLEDVVRAMFGRDKELQKANLKVDADVTKNEITLSGTVDSEAIRDKAVELTKTAQVGVVVNDRIGVRPSRNK